jgi:hypothetical protein
LAIGGPDRFRIDLFNKCGAKHVLVSYAYIRKVKNLVLPFEEVLLDSGAFSVETGVEKVNLSSYMLWLQLYLKYYPQITNYINLDDLSDPNKSIENWLTMKSEGLNAMPVYHYGEPDDILEYYTSKVDYIGLGGMAVGTMPWQKLKEFWENVHFRYPQHKFHLLGVGTVQPFFYTQPYSIDSTSWNVGSRFGDLMCLKDGLPYRFAMREMYGFHTYFSIEELFANNIRAQIDWEKLAWLDKVPPRSEQERLEL